MFSFLLGKYLALELLGNMINVSLTIRGTARLFSCTVLCIYFSVGHIWDFQFLHILPNTGFICLFYFYNHTSECEVFFHGAFGLHFPIVLSFFYISFGEIPIQILTLILFLFN